MKKIGVLFGQENTFPGALVEKINSMHLPDIQAEFVQVGGVRHAVPSGYEVIVDRISHDIPFYRAYLKNAVLTGTKVINNPFWWSADDKFFNYALAEKLGVAVPPTVILPHKDYPQGTTAKSMRNLEYPLDWDGIFAYVGFPAFLKPFDGGGWRDVYHVHSPEDLFRAYDQSRDLCMTLQKAVNFNEYFRCYVVGQEKVHIMPYDPRRPHAERYVQGGLGQYDKKLIDRVEKDALTLCRALGYDLNTVEFAVEDGIPYAIDFMNPAPDADIHSVGQENFDWIVNAVAELAVKKAQQDSPAATGFLWSSFLSGGAIGKPAKKAAAKAPAKAAPKKAAATKAPAKKAAKKAPLSSETPSLKSPEPPDTPSNEA
jgi:glutathione synthase/RimK-type ligase-like ATP-grasp enzyme